jgi:hypothetical protein
MVYAVNCRSRSYFFLACSALKTFHSHPILKLADSGVLVLVAYVLSLILIIATAGSRKPNVFVVVISAVEIGAALLLHGGLWLFWGLRGDRLTK